MKSIAEVVGGLRFAPDDELKIEIVETQRGNFSIAIEQIDQFTKAADEPCRIVVHQHDLPAIIRLLQKTYRRASALSALAVK